MMAVGSNTDVVDTVETVVDVLRNVVFFWEGASVVVVKDETELLLLELVISVA
jgi:hypothetical protein